MPGAADVARAERSDARGGVSAANPAWRNDAMFPGLRLRLSPGYSRHQPVFLRIHSHSVSTASLRARRAPHFHLALELELPGDVGAAGPRYVYILSRRLFGGIELRVPDAYRIRMRRQLGDDRLAVVAGLVEYDRACGNAGIERQFETLGRGERIPLVAHVVVIGERHGGADEDRGYFRREFLVDLIDDASTRALASLGWRPRATVRRHSHNDRVRDVQTLVVGYGDGDLGGLCLRRADREREHCDE